MVDDKGDYGANVDAGDLAEVPKSCELNFQVNEDQNGEHGEVDHIDHNVLVELSFNGH